MVFGVIFYFLLATAALAVLFLDPVRARAARYFDCVVQGGRTAVATATSGSQCGLSKATLAVAHGRRQSLQWMRRYGVWAALGTALVVSAPLLAIALHGLQELDGYDHTASRPIDEHIAALLQGEQLVPPPPLPPELFTTREVEQARPLIRSASRQWELLDDDFRQRLLVVFKIMRERHGYEMVLLEGYRAPERQAELAALGTQVTQAGAFQSYHQFGLAADSAFLRNGRIVISEADPWAMRGYELYGETARSVGLTWGGSWKSIKDLGHVELSRQGVLPAGTASRSADTESH